MTVFIVGAAAGFFRARFDARVLRDDHAQTSFKQAFNLATCGSTSLSALPERSLTALFPEPADYRLPVRDTVARRFGSMAEYCRGENAPYMNNENGLMLLAYVSFALRPGSSLAQVQDVFQVLRWLCIAVFVYACSRIGCSVWTASTAAALAGAILTDQAQGYLAYSTYIWFVPLVLLNVGYYTVCLRRASRPRNCAVVMLVGGTIAALTYDIRSTFVLIAGAIACVFGCVVRAGFTGARGRAGFFAACSVAIIAFATGFFLIQGLWLGSMLPAQNATNYSYHAIAHPLVLGLAVPASDLSTREGIEWVDSAGPVLARRVDPTVSYLDPRYERTLFTYYGRLWRRYPGEMLSIYREKARLAGVSIIQSFHSYGYISKVFELPLAPFAPLKDGAALTLGLTAVAAILGARAVLRRSAPAFFAATLTMVPAMLQMESTLIVPSFALKLHSVSLFCLAFLPVLACEAIVAGAGRVRARADQPASVLEPRTRSIDQTSNATLGFWSDVVIGGVASLFMSGIIALVIGAAATVSEVLGLAAAGGLIYAAARRKTAAEPSLLLCAVAVVVCAIGVFAAGGSAGAQRLLLLNLH
jgi:hypothetical protein